MTHFISRSLILTLALALIGSCKKDSSSESVPAPHTPPATNTKSVLLVVTSNDQLKDGSSAGYFLPEAIDFYQALKAAGYSVTIASPAGGKAPMYERNTYVNTHKTYLDTSGLLYLLDHTLPLNTIQVANYQTVCYVGGFACLFDFPTNGDIKRITAGIYESGGIVAAVCHAPAALLNVTLSSGKPFIQNKKLTARTIAEETNNGQVSKDDVLYFFPFILEDALKTNQAIFSHSAVGSPYVVVDERLVTGQNPESTKKVAEQVIALMKR